MKNPPAKSTDRAARHYGVRVSPRAKRMQLRVTPLGRVEVVVPQGFDLARVPAFVAEHRAWLHRTLARLQQQRGEYDGANEVLPSRIALLAVGQAWRTRYSSGPVCRVRVTPEAGAGCLHVVAHDEASCRALLQKWLTAKAKEELIPWLQRTSRELGLPFGRASVRGQKTRWGSCSARKHISLNRSLLFLPPHLVRYLFVHELCHTVHLNHSRRYWSLVGRIEPDYQELDAAMRGASRYVPYWACPE